MELKTSGDWIAPPEELQTLLEQVVAKQGLVLFESRVYPRQGAYVVDVFVAKREAVDYAYGMDIASLENIHEVMAEAPQVTVGDCELVSGAITQEVERFYPQTNYELTVSSPGMFRALRYAWEYEIYRNFLLKLQAGDLKGEPRGFVAEVFLLGNSDGLFFPWKEKSETSPKGSTEALAYLWKSLERYQAQGWLLEEALASWSQTGLAQAGILFVSWPPVEKWNHNWSDLLRLVRAFVAENAAAWEGKDAIHGHDQEIQELWQDYSAKARGKFIKSHGPKLTWQWLDFARIKQASLEYLF